MRIIWALIFILMTLAPSQAAEQILSFDATIRVNRDASLDVTEKIVVKGEMVNIQRGIFRDLPTLFRENALLYRKAGLEIKSVKRDGKPEPYHTKDLSDGIRLYIGDPKVFLGPGHFTYEISYHTTKQLRFFEAYDELYWNVTGNGWTFPMGAVNATIILPDGTSITQHTSYTGPVGSTDNLAEVVEQSGNRIRFATTHWLNPEEGLTIAVAWPKGIVTEPGEGEKTGNFLQDNLAIVILLNGVFWSVALYLWAWVKFGRDPVKGPIIPRFKAPEGLSPAAVSYVHAQGYASGFGTGTPFLAALVSLAVKGRVLLGGDDGGSPTIEKAGSHADPLPAGEAALEEHLFKNDDVIKLSKSNRSTLSKAVSSFQSALDREHGGVFFKRNIGKLIPGIIVSLLGVIGYCVFAPNFEHQTPFILSAVVFGSVGLGIAFGGLTMLFKPGGEKFLGVVLLLFGTFFMAPVLIFSEIGINEQPFILSLMLMSPGMLLAAFIYLIHQPTLIGQKMLDEIEGLKLYLSVAEEERMKMFEKPEMSIRHYEDMLPYAIALDVEQPWSEALEVGLAAMTQSSRGQSYRPEWDRSGRDYGRIGAAVAVAGIAGAIQGSMASATATSSSSSSGSSGGGSSGGGGGGGGGGGW